MSDPQDYAIKTTVHVRTVGEVVQTLRAVRVPHRIATMRATFGVWNPLYDRLVELWCSTVDGPAPYLDEQARVQGGWPCRRWPADWAERRQQWLADFENACRETPFTGRNAHPRSNFSRLHTALLECPADSGRLSPRDVGWIRRALANTAASNGHIGSPQRQRVRAGEQSVATAHTRVDYARELADRLAGRPADAWIESFADVVSESWAHFGRSDPNLEFARRRLRWKARRGSIAPIRTLVGPTLWRAGQVAAVLPQITPRITGDPVTAAQLLRDLAFETIDRFPERPLSDQLLAQFRILADIAGISLHVVDDITPSAVDRGFPDSWRDVAAVNSGWHEGSLYGRYYDLPGREFWTSGGIDFGAVCAARAEAEIPGWVTCGATARHRAVLEQAHILTAQNLSTMVSGLNLRCLGSGILFQFHVVQFIRSLTQPTPPGSGTVNRLRRSAVIWRHIVFHLSHADRDHQRRFVQHMLEWTESAGLTDSFGPAVQGLARVVDGERFTSDGTFPAGAGRRFVGCAPHELWNLPTRRPQ